MRPVPRITPSAIIAGIRFDPNGAHQLEVAVPGEIVGMRFSRDQVEQLDRVIAEFRRAVLFEDGGPDRHRPHFVPIEVAR